MYRQSKQDDSMKTKRYLNARFNIRLSHTELKEIERASKVLGISMSELVREAVTGFITVNATPPADKLEGVCGND